MAGMMARMLGCGPLGVMASRWRSLKSMLSTWRRCLTSAACHCCCGLGSGRSSRYGSARRSKTLC